MNWRRIRFLLRDRWTRLVSFDLRAPELGRSSGRFRKMLRRMREGAISVAHVDAPDLTFQKTRRTGRKFFERFGAWLLASPFGWPVRTWRTGADALRLRMLQRGFHPATVGRLMVLLALVLFAAGGVALYFGGRSAASKIRNASFRSSARSAVAKEDWTKARAALVDGLLKYRPNDVEGNLLLADVLRKQDSPQEFGQRKRIAELILPEDPARRLDAAETALRLRQPGLASNELELVPEKERQGIAYLRLRVETDLALNRPNERLEPLLRAILKLAPDDASAKLRLLGIEYQGTRDKERQAELRQGIETLAARPEVAADALRLLTVTQLQAGEKDAAMQSARRLMADRNATVRDSVLELTVLLAAAPSLVEPSLARLQDRVARDPTGAFEVCRWMLSQNRAVELDRWLDSLVPEVRDSPVFRIVRADSSILQKQWARLDALTTGGDSWGEADLQRAAFSARAARELGQLDVARTRWAGAIRMAGDSLPALRQLRVISNAWAWQDERAEVDWALMRVDPPVSKDLLPGLYAHYRDRVDAKGLRRVFEKIVELRPDDIPARRNLATLYLVARLQLPRAYELAKEVYAQDPASTDNLIVYAFSLHVRGETAEALSLIETRRAEVLAKPYCAGYYGLILAASGRAAEAKPLLEGALETKLLDEESEMFRAEIKKQ